MTKEQAVTLLRDGTYVFTDQELKAIADLLDAKTPPPGHILDDGGVVRKVVGNLPITADGVVVMMGEEVFHPDQDPSFHLEVMQLLEDTDPDPDFPLPEDCEYMGHYSYFERDTGYATYESYDVRECYSTRDAAEAARAKA